FGKTRMEPLRSVETSDRAAPAEAQLIAIPTSRAVVRRLRIDLLLSLVTPARSFRSRGPAAGYRGRCGARRIRNIRPRGKSQRRRISRSGMGDIGSTPMIFLDFPLLPAYALC